MPTWGVEFLWGRLRNLRDGGLSKRCKTNSKQQPEPDCTGERIPPTRVNESWISIQSDSDWIVINFHLKLARFCCLGNRPRSFFGCVLGPMFRGSVPTTRPRWKGGDRARIDKRPEGLTRAERD